MHPIRPITVAGVALAMMASALANPAFARLYADDVTRQCSQIVGRMSFPGDAGERNKDRLFNACLENGGGIPG